ncbi:MAG: hypothetical protein QOE34_1408 [Verrucomicrobiota bacterium]
MKLSRRRAGGHFSCAMPHRVDSIIRRSYSPFALRRGSQVVRSGSAKPLFAGSIPAPASHSFRRAERDADASKPTSRKLNASFRFWLQALSPRQFLLSANLPESGPLESASHFFCDVASDRPRRGLEHSAPAMSSAQRQHLRWSGPTGAKSERRSRRAGHGSRL